MTDVHSTKHVAILTLAGLALATPAFASELHGTWARDDGNARVSIAPCGDKVCATNVWIRDAASGEAVGDRLVMTLTQKGDTYSGSAYDTKRKLNLSMTIKASAKALDTRGCVVGGLLCRQVKWSAIGR